MYKSNDVQYQGNSTYLVRQTKNMISANNTIQSVKRSQLIQRNKSMCSTLTKFHRLSYNAMYVLQANSLF